MTEMLLDNQPQPFITAWKPLITITITTAYVRRYSKTHAYTAPLYCGQGTFVLLVLTTYLSID